MRTITMTSGLTGHWTKMHQSLVKFSESETSNHAPSWADFTITTSGFRFSVHTAIALRHQGIEVLVLEQAEVLSEIGAGIQIAGNAAIVLRELGLESAMRAVGVKPQSYDYRDLRTGRMLYQAPLGDEAARRYGAPMYNVHRADLIQSLFDAVPAGSKRLCARCVAISQTNDAVEVRLQTGETLKADVLVGCDGIHSVVRQHLRGQEEKHFANITMG